MKEKVIVRLKKAARILLPVFSLEESIAGDNSSPKVLYAGYSRAKLHQIGAFVYSKKPFKIKFLGISHWSDFGNPSKKLLAHDLIFAEINIITKQYFERFGGFLIPKWIDITLNLRDSVKQMRILNPRRFGDVERLIRKYHWEYEVKEDSVSMNDFYSSMYVPYLKKHGSATSIESHADFTRFCKSSYLLFAKRNNVKLAGALVVYGEKYALLKYAGITNGYLAIAKEGAVGALYYFTIMENQRRGYTDYNLGGTSPFLKDELTKYKLSFGGQVAQNKSEEDAFLWMSARKDSLVARDFLNNNPFVSIGRNGLMTIETHK